ncbi:winged helix-turn-helix domain-containing protein [Allonocardiopsis opalescens]|uniref:Transcriptional regulator n=1 Tax=Allonocardiopsis opalescens TaxID=1144618 RepID=A0A2T0Q0L3_9ACTN|nr:winged helix-turn-helix domain-containing protein [Allonocardiopsis opalescens]PRX97306.1 transcriptional regulator [Allonocardiopsis opalescens]
MPSRATAAPLAVPGLTEPLVGVIPIDDGDRLMVVVGRIVERTGRRAPAEPRHPRPHDPLVVDRDSHRAWLDGDLLDLTHREFELLAHLHETQGRAWSRRQLIARLWGGDPAAGSRTVDVHVHRLRRKLRHHAARLVTVRGVGYRFEPGPPAPPSPEPPA